VAEEELNWDMLERRNLRATSSRDPGWLPPGGCMTNYVYDLDTLADYKDSMLHHTLCMIRLITYSAAMQTKSKSSTGFYSFHSLLVAGFTRRAILYLSIQKANNRSLRDKAINTSVVPDLEA